MSDFVKLPNINYSTAHKKADPQYSKLKKLQQVLHKTIYFTIQTTCYITKHCQ